MRLVRVPGGWADAHVNLVELGWENLLVDPRPVAAYTHDGRLLVFNDPFQQLLCWPIETIDERGWIACLYPELDEQEVTLRHARELSRPGGLPRRHSRRVTRGDGTQIILDLISTPIQLPDGTPVVFTSGIDATQRPTPLGIQRGFRELVEDAPDILSRIDVRTGHFLFVSRAVERLTGYTPEDLYADPDLTRKALLDEYRLPLKLAMEAVARGEPQWLRLEYRCKDEQVVTLDQVLYPIRDASNRVVVVEGVARDITAVRVLEQRLRQTVIELQARNEELASLDRLKSQLLANVSHELRTPLVTIKGYNELLLRGSLGPLSERQERALKSTAQSTERLIELIETLLDFAQREEGRPSLRRERFDLRQVVREAITQLGGRLTDKGLTLDVVIAKETLLVVGDRGRLIQAVKALLSNAGKFCEAPGQVRVAVQRERDRIGIAVSDSGIGIPAAVLGKIFDRFYQVDASTTRRFGGTGLGLAFAKEIAALHGGTISVESEEGQGSTFTLWLPATTDELPTERDGALTTPITTTDEPVRVDAPTGAGTRKQRVMVIDDEPEIVDYTRFLLEREGCDVVTATSAEAALDELTRAPPDLVILDVALDGMSGELDGLELCRRLKASPGSSDVPVLIVTAVCSEDVRDEAMAAGASGFLVKPFELSEFLGEVRQHVQGCPAASQRN